MKDYKEQLEIAEENLSKQKEMLSALLARYGLSSAKENEETKSPVGGIVDANNNIKDLEKRIAAINAAMHEDTETLITLAKEGNGISYVSFFGLDLSGQDLSGSTWTSNNFRACSFEGANLDDAQFILNGVEYSSFREASMVNTRLYSDEKYKNVDFDLARMEYADLSNCKLYNATFRGADLEGANIKKAQFEHCVFDGYEDHASLKRTITNMSFIKAEKAYFELCSFRFTNLTCAELYDAKTKQCNTSTCNLEGARLYRRPDSLFGS